MDKYFVLMSTVVLSAAKVSGQFQWAGGKWPVEGCHSRNVDLVFITDAVTPEQYVHQMRFFARLVDVFCPQAETDLGRLRVALVAFRSDGSGSTVADIRISLDAHQSKSDLKQAIEKNAFVSSNVTFDMVMNVIQNWFKKTSTLTRQDALHLVIMAATSIKVSERILTTQDASTATPVTLSFPLFVVIFQRDLYVLFGQFSQKNSLAFVPDIRGFDAIKNNLSISLCRQCLDGWVSKVENSSDGSPARVACYKLERTEAQQNWIDVRALCEREHFSNLAAFETKQELMFVRNFLLQDKHFLTALTNKTKTPVGVFIGLKREEWTRGRRFKWVNNMPLVHTYWGNDQPMNAVSASCALWAFITKLYTPQSLCPGKIDNGSNLDDTNHTDCHRDNFVDHWSSVGCGSYSGTFFLCESDYEIENEYPDGFPGETWILKSPAEYKILRAFNKGDLSQTSKGTLISASSVRIFTGSRIIANPNATKLEFVPKFECEKDGMSTISYSAVCDFHFDCQNRRDEKICNYRDCKPEYEFTCRSGQCISKDLVCDLYNDCRDGDDEMACFLCPHARCQDGRCLPKHWFSDGEIDCDTCSSNIDRELNEKSPLDDYISLEISAALMTDPNGCVFTCNRTQCVALSMLNDGIVDCLGSEGPLDETIGALQSTTCYGEESALKYYSNWAPKCVYIKDRYGEPLGCRNMKHLENCEDFICPEGYVKCPESYCIPSHYVHNSVFDCANGEDEDESLSLECPGYFVCASDNKKHQCLHVDLVCDGFRHCSHGDDEKNCDVACEGGFLCAGGTVTPSRDHPVSVQDLNFVDYRTRYLDLSGIDLSKVFPISIIGHFSNILTAKLSDCNIVNVNDWSVMNEFRSMQTLDLSYNKITDTTVSCIFRFMPSLKFLNLSMNDRLVSLSISSFRLLQKPNRSPLETLDLSFTGLTDLRWAVFKPLASLTYLSLRGTRIAMIKPDLFPENFVLVELDMRGLSALGIVPGVFTNVTITSKMFVDNFKLCCPQLHNQNTSIVGCQFQKDPFSSCSDLMSSGILRTILWVNGISAVSGNGAVILYRVVFDKRIFRMGYGHFVTHLGISDMLMGIYLITIAAVDSFYRDSYIWKEESWKNSSLCKFSGLISTLSVEVSTFFIFLITLDRFLVIRFPFGLFRMKGRSVAVVCVTVWALGLTIALMPGLPYFGDWSVYTTTGMCLGLPLISDENPGWHFVQSVYIYLNFVLFLIIAFGQIAIYRTMSSMSMNQNCLTNSSARRSQDLTVAKRLSLVAVSNFLCWCPVGVMGVVVLAGQQMGIEAYAWLAAVVLPINSAINPLVYTIPGLIVRMKKPIDSPTQQFSLKSQSCRQ